ncbi:MAG: phosphatase PAP2 family protein [DPANN group archaeon]|nr:phosphatase PAP2 family protein [DPANN group archaeon]
MTFIQSLLPAIEHFPIISYWIALLVAALETTIGVGLLIPGSTILLLMGALAAKGYLDLGDLLWFAVIGAIIGDNINYIIGKRYGARIFKKGFWFIKPAHFKKGEAFFERHGPKSVFIGRFIPSIKEVIPLTAGTFGMRRLPFMVWNTLGAIGWSLVWILPGYFFARSLAVAKIWLTRTGFFLTILLVLFLLSYVLRTLLVRKGKEFFSFLSSLWLSVRQALMEDPGIKAFTARHERFFSWSRKRLDKDDFYGLPLTLLSLALFYTVALFGGIVEDIIRSDLIVSVDIRVANLLAVFRSTDVTSFFFWITLLGKWQVILSFTIAFLFLLWFWKRRTHVVPFLLTLAGSEAFTFIGKIIIRRARPAVAFYTEQSYSFPSGHAAIAVAFYGFLAYCVIRNTRKWRYKINIFFAGLLIILLVGFSRLYLGVHYLSDVWGGYLVGAIWLIIGMSLSEYLLSRRKKRRVVRADTRRLLATAGIIVLAIGFYVLFALQYQIPDQIPAPISTEAQTVSVDDIMTIFRTEQSRYTETLLGNRQEPLSLIIVAKDDQQLIDLFAKADWTLADKVDIFSVYKAAKAALLKEPYPQAPMTPDFWNSEVHDFGFEKETKENNVRTRHHARLWKTAYVTPDGEHIYVGTASFDSGIKWGVTHRINPDIDTEREFLFRDLKRTGMIATTKKQEFVKPKLGSNFTGDLFFTDGRLYLLFLKG